MNDGVIKALLWVLLFILMVLAFYFIHSNINNSLNHIIWLPTRCLSQISGMR